MLNFVLKTHRVAALAVGAAMVLVALYLATQTYRIKIAPAELQAAMNNVNWPKTEAAAAAAREGIVNPRGVVKMFDLDAEGNLPAIWSVVQLIAAALLLLVIAKHHRTVGDGTSWLWMILGFGFLFLALDEGGSIHSSFYLSSSTQGVRKARGIFYFSWIIPAMIAVAVVGLFYLRFLWRLPTATRWLFILAGAWYVGSAVGGEMAQGWWAAQGLSKVRFSWAAMTIAEEAGEMLSIALFVCTLLDYMRRESITLQLRVVGAAAPAVLAVRSAPIKHLQPSLDDVEEEAGMMLPR